MGQLKRVILHKDHATFTINSRVYGDIEIKIDIDDIEKVSKYKWHVIYDKTIDNFYVCHRINNKTNKKCIKLHRLIMDCPRDMEIDHVNHNTLDNRKCNLKIVTHFQNQQNLRSKTTEQTGVFKRNRKGREYWTANISKDCKRYTKDCKTKEDAIKWRKNMEYKLYNLGGDAYANGKVA